MSIIKYIEDNHKKNRPLSLTLFERLQEDILSNNLKTGDKLTESKLCKEYNVSRTPLREALRQLESDGLIETIPNRGAFVAGLSPQDVSDLTELRNQAEISAVRWAIERITEKEREELDETFEFMQFYTHKNDIPKMLNINKAFHKVIYNATHNKMLIKSLNEYQLYLSYTNPSNYYEPNYLREVLYEHREIYNAFLSHDKDAGEAAMRYHMTNSMKRKFR
ncbi:MAG: GntR family transcriptional regulator [Hornefia sp.]|nr:GntR family transcriptional regulator [Hornefia sp.]